MIQKILIEMMKEIIWSLSLRMVTLLYFALGCSYTFYLKSDNTICKEKSCDKEEVTSMYLSLGQTICFTDSRKGDTTKIRLDQAYHLHYYRQLYYTCDYSLETTSHMRCWDSNSNCNVHSCKPHIKTDNGYPKRKTNSTIYTYTGCMKQGTCEGYCGWDSYDRCLWGVSELIEGACYPLLKRYQTVWGTEFSITQNGSTLLTTVSETNPFAYGTIDLLVTKMSGPTLTSQFSSESLLLIEKDIGLPVASSPLDQPIPHLLGDYQKSNDMSIVKFPLETLLKCKSVGCMLSCILPESPLKSLTAIKMWKKRKEYNYVTRISKSSFQYLYKESLPYFGINLLTNKKGLDRLNIKPASCNFEVISTIACSGCLSNTHIIMKAISLKSPGVMYIKSNCSLTPKYLRCQDEPFNVQISQDDTYCEILTYSNRRRRGNYTQRLIINIDFVNLGILTPLSYLTTLSHDPSNWEAATTLLTSSDFISGLCYTISTTAAFLLIARIMALVWSAILSKKVAEGK